MGLFKPVMRVWILLLIAMVPLAGCTTNAATGRSQFLPLSWEEEVKLGAEASPQFIQQSGGELPDQRVVSYVRAMGSRIAAQSEMPDIDWEFHVLDSQVINAFALPGGKVFISRGLMEKMDNDAQLAGVIGHEIGHVTARHGNERMGKAIIAQGVLLGIGVAGAVSDEQWMQVLGVGTAVGGQLFLLKYSRSNELEADELGVRYMTRVGYHPVGLVQVMELLGQLSSGAGPPEWLSTHPVSETRVENLEELILGEYGELINNPAHFTMGFESFKQNIKIPLSQLPPARHGDSAMISPDDFEKAYGMTWQQAAHAGSASHPHPHPHTYPHHH